MGINEHATLCAIGVPKVPFRILKDGLGNELVGTMLYLDAVEKKDLNLYINCSGGEVVSSLAMTDTMRYIKSDVASVGFGGCIGMAGFLLAMGQKSKRCSLRNTRIVLHHPTGVA